MTTFFDRFDKVSINNRPYAINEYVVTFSKKDNIYLTKQYFTENFEINNTTLKIDGFEFDIEGLEFINKIKEDYCPY